MDNSQHLAVLDQVESSLKAIEEQGREVIDFETDEGYARAKQIKKPLVKLRNDGDKARLAATKYHRDEQARINDLWKSIAERIEAVEGPLTDGIKRVDEEAKRIKAEDAAAEQKRIDDIQERMADIRAAAGNAITLDDVTAAIARYGNVTLESFEEFAEEAEQAIAAMDTALIEKRTALEAQAAESARLAEQKAEQDRIAAEQKAAQDKIDAQIKAIEDAKRADEQRQAEEAAAAERQAEQERREKAIAEQSEIDKQKALDAAENKRLADIETAKQEAIQVERGKAAAIEAARIAKEQQEAADKAEADRLAAIAPDTEKLRTWLDQMPKMKSQDGKVVGAHILEFTNKKIEALRKFRAA